MVFMPRIKSNPNARRLNVVRDVDELDTLVDTGAGAGSVFSTGGMATKLAAAFSKRSRDKDSDYACI